MRLKTFLLGGVALLMLPVSARAQNALEIYGGTAFGNTLDYAGVPADTDAGAVLGGGFYFLLPGPFEIGVDVMGSKRDYTGLPTSLSSRSVMANGRFTFPLGTTSMTGYAGLGLGMINVEYDGASLFPAASGDDTVPGGQVAFGVRYNLAAGTVFSELRYQTAFDDAMIAGQAVEYSSTSLLVGFRMTF